MRGDAVQASFTRQLHPWHLVGGVSTVCDKVTSNAIIPKRAQEKVSNKQSYVPCRSHARMTAARTAGATVRSIPGYIRHRGFASSLGGETPQHTGALV